jgi:hypothetical protein
MKVLSRFRLETCGKETEYGNLLEMAVSVLLSSDLHHHHHHHHPQHRRRYKNYVFPSHWMLLLVLWQWQFSFPSGMLLQMFSSAD